MITAGVDVGSLTAKAAILADGQIQGWSLIRTSADSAASAEQAFNLALDKARVSLAEVTYIVATGYGRAIVPFAHGSVTEISCHARGAHWFSPEVRTILDMGGQDCKAIRCDGAGKVTNFIMNDKCAAGAGRYLEKVAEALELPLDEIGPRSLKSTQPATVSAFCAVFAYTEIVALLRQGAKLEDILAGACQALAERILPLLRRVGVEETFVISGGIAKNVGVVRCLETRLGVKAKICFEPQIVGAVGASLFARDRLQKKLALR